MNEKLRKYLILAVVILLAAIVAVSAVKENRIIPVIALVIAIVLITFLRRKSKEVTKDERTSRIYEKASAATIRFSVPLIAIVAGIIILFRSSFSPEIGEVGNALAYTACGLLLAHLAFYSYFDRKL